MIFINKLNITMGYLVNFVHISMVGGKKNTIRYKDKLVFYIANSFEVSTCGSTK